MGVSVDVSLLCVTDTLVRLVSSVEDTVPRKRDGILFVKLEANASSEMNLRV